MTFNPFVLLLLGSLIFSKPLMAAPYQNIWGQLLQRHVSHTQTKGMTTTVVDYEELGQSPSFLALVRYVEQMPIPTNTDEAFAFWLDAYHMALVKAFTRYPHMQSPDFYNTGLITISGIPMSLGMIKDKIAPLTAYPLALFLTDGTLGSPDFPTRPVHNTSAESYCKERVQALLKNNSKGLKIEPNTHMLYASQHIVDALGSDWLHTPDVQSALENINPNGYKVKILPYDQTPNRR